MPKPIILSVRTPGRLKRVRYEITVNADGEAEIVRVGDGYATRDRRVSLAMRDDQPSHGPEIELAVEVSPC